MRRTVLSLAALAFLAMAWNLGRLSSETGTGPTVGTDRAAPPVAESPMPERPVLPRAAAEARAAERPGDALTLLALGRATGDPGWLERALAEHPDDPRVQLERWHAATTPEEKLAAARALKAAAPDNPLGSYLEATLAFERGDLGAVAGLLMDAEENRAYESYTRDILLEAQAAFQASGLDDLGARRTSGDAGTGRLADDLLRLGDEMGELQLVFVELGYWDEADFLFERALALGEQLQASGTLAEALAGIALQGRLLESFGPELIVSDDGTRAGQRLAELEAARSVIRDASIGADTAMRTLDAAGQERYREIFRRDGELSALRWLKARGSADGEGK